MNKFNAFGGGAFFGDPTNGTLDLFGKSLKTTAFAQNAAVITDIDSRLQTTDLAAFQTQGSDGDFQFKNGGLHSGGAPLSFDGIANEIIIQNFFIDANGDFNKQTGGGNPFLTTSRGGGENVGFGAGVFENLEGTALRNTAMGDAAMSEAAQTVDCTVFGNDVCSSMEDVNEVSAFGAGALKNMQVAQHPHCAFGFQALFNADGDEGPARDTGECAYGWKSLHQSSGEGENCFYGNQSGVAVSSGTHNVGYGNSVLPLLTIGNRNHVYGHGGGTQLTSGSDNFFAGFLAGSAITTTDNNICIQNPGVLGDAGVTRLGETGVHTSAFIAGVSGVTPAGATETVVMDTSTGELGTALSALSIEFINGYQISGTGVATRTIAAGGCCDSTNTANIVSSAPIAVDIATSGAGGLDTGSEAANTW